MNIITSLSRFFKRIFNKNNLNICLYLLGIVCLFLSCQTLKSSSIIKKDNTKYNNCLKYLSPQLYQNDVTKVCMILNHKESFEDFVYNIMFTMVLVHLFVPNRMKINLNSLLYWSIAHLSAITFSIIGEFKIFQFSIDSMTKINTSHILILGIPGIIIFFVLLRQIYYHKINIGLIILFILSYLITYFIFLSYSSNIIFHFHHALVAGFISIFFSDYNSRFDRICHAINLGIIVQGLCFFRNSELFLFYVPIMNSPDLTFMIIITLIFFSIWGLLVFLKNKFCIEDENYDDTYFELRNLM